MKDILLLPINTSAVQIATETVTAPSLKGHSEKEIKKVCADFEAMFIKQMLEMMRKGMPKGGYLDGGFQEEIYMSLFDDQLSKVLSEGKGMGIGAQLYRDLVHKYGKIKDK
ncbi:MAG: rod-binding protein [Dissulfurimicrobium sp.]|uniref:rod-binding protein n=1 Tax=Dissulfurimicrobium sp. TaxID=2022436 RepID=UPI00404AD0CF